MAIQRVQVIYGPGSGKSAAALGKAVRAAGDGKEVYFIQFLKGSQGGNLIEFMKKLEPEVKVFRFEKHVGRFSELNDDDRKEELINIKNGLNFAKKVIATRGCDMLILDEILGLVDRGIIETDELIKVIDAVPEDMELIVTGKVLAPAIKDKADLITIIDSVK